MLRRREELPELPEVASPATARATPLFVERQAVNDSPAQWSTLVVECAALSPIDYDLPHTQDLQS